MEQEPTFLLIVKVVKGVVIRDTPRPESQGGKAMRSAAVGSALYAHQIINVAGVEYARLVPQNPLKPEWVRVSEADHSIEYVDVIELKTKAGISELTSAITLLTVAIRDLAKK